MGPAIPPDNHVVRTVGKEKWDFAGDGVTVVIESGMFLPRRDHPRGTGPEEFVSVDWLECFAGALREQLDEVREAVAARRVSGKVGLHAQLASVLVDHVHDAAAKEGKAVDVCGTGDANDPSHSGIYGLDPLDHKIAQEITRRAKAYPAYS